MSRTLEIEPPEHLPAPPLRPNATASIQFFDNMPIIGHTDRPQLRLFIRNDWN